MTMLLAGLFAAATLQPAEPPPALASAATAQLSCPPAVLGRTESGAELRIAMQQYSAFYGPYLTLRLNRTPAEFRTTLIRIGDRNFADGRPLPILDSRGLVVEDGQTMHLLRSGLAALRASDHVQLRSRDDATETFAIDREAVWAFGTCIDALPPGSSETPDDAQSNVSSYVLLKPNRAPAHGPRPMLTYPTTALREDRQGDTLVQVVIQPNGMAIDCTIVSSSGSPDLDLASCEATRRMRFRVATDAASEPVRAPVHIPFVWRIAN
jgi:TonB family protein